jgi:hypothetical protein
VKKLESCSSRTFGSGTQRLQCWDDVDCLSGQCDPISRECLLATDPANLFWKVCRHFILSESSLFSISSSLFQCVQGILTGDNQLRVDLFFRNITAEEGAGLLQEEFNRLDECLTDSGASLTYHPRYSRVSLWADCEVPGKLNCLDDGCSLPVRYSGQVLSGRIGTGCDYVWVSFHSPWFSCSSTFAHNNPPTPVLERRRRRSLY